MFSAILIQEFFISKYSFYFRLRYFVLECLGPDVPAIYLMRLNPESRKSQLVALLDNNTETLEFEAKMAWPTIKKFTIPLPGK